MTQNPKMTLLRTALMSLLLAAPFPAIGQGADPITTGATELLDESGVLARQSRLGEGVLLLDRQLRHAEAIEKLIEVLGPDALIEVAPGEFLRFSDTPAGLRARLELMRLQRELDQMAAPVTPAAGAQPARSDGTELIELIDQRLNELTQTGADPDPGIGPEAQDRTLSVREIFGSGTNLSAILQYGPDRVRVRAGDSLVGGLRIVSIEPDGVRATRRGQEILLRLPN